MSTIYVPSTAPTVLSSSPSLSSSISTVVYPSPFSHPIPHYLPPRAHPFDLDYDYDYDPMFGDKYRRNYNRVHRNQQSLALYNSAVAYGGAAATYGLQPSGVLPVTTAGYYPNTYAAGAYPYTAGMGAGYQVYGGYPQTYPSMGYGQPAYPSYDPSMMRGYDSDYGYELDHRRRLPQRRRYRRRGIMSDPYLDYDHDYDF